MATRITTFPVGFLARVNYALLFEPYRLNFTRQLSTPIVESKTGELDVSQYLTPAQLDTYLEKIEWIKQELASPTPSHCVQLGFYGSDYDALGFSKTFDYTYAIGGMTNEVAAGRKLIISAVQKFVAEKKDTPISVASLGCGDGALNAAYGPILPEGSRMLLLDLLPSALETAVKNMSDAWKTRKGGQCPSWEATAAKGGFFSLPYNLSTFAEGAHLDFLEPNSVDLVESTLVAHHVSGIEAFFREVRRVLRPGPQGRLLYADSHEANTNEEVPGVKEKGFDEACMFEPKPVHFPYHGVNFVRSRTEIVTAMLKNGLELLDMRRITPTVTFFVAQLS